MRGRARAYNDGTHPRFVQMDMLDSTFPGCVVVINAGDEERAAHWGELMSHTAKARGPSGVVIAGGVRDTPQILELGFACFRRYHSPLTARWRFDITEFHVPIRIGGVAIAPGDSRPPGSMGPSSHGFLARVPADLVARRPLGILI